MRDTDFEWDDAKAARNVLAHNVTFEAARLAFHEPRWIEFDDPDPDEDRFLRLCYFEGEVLANIYTERGDRVRIISARRAPSMCKEPTSTSDLTRYGMTADAWRQLRAMTDAEVEAAAAADPDAQPATPEQLARARPPALAKRVRQKLRLGQESFAAAYGIPLATLRAWERHEIEANSVELAYLRLIEREPERARIETVAAAE